jgi:AcrR family transcriptional regulator
VSRPAAVRTAEPGVPKAEQSRRTRDLIVRTGADCLARYGYAQTTMLLIANEAGLSRGPLHYHFKDKYEVMSAIARALPKSSRTDLIRALEAKSGPAERLAALIDLGLEEHTGPHHFVAMELLMAARNDPDLAAAIAPHLQTSEREVDAWYVEYLSLLRWPRERLVAFRRLTVACLRGLALDQVIQEEGPAHAEAMAMFREIFLNYALRDDERP